MDEDYLTVRTDNNNNNKTVSISTAIPHCVRENICEPSIYILIFSEKR